MIRNDDLKQELSNMPEYFTIDELVGKLLVLEKRQRENIYGNQLVNISVQELDMEMEKWFKM